MTDTKALRDRLAQYVDDSVAKQAPFIPLHRATVREIRATLESEAARIAGLERELAEARRDVRVDLAKPEDYRIIERALAAMTADRDALAAENAKLREALQRAQDVLLRVDVKIGGMFACMRHGMTPSDIMIEQADAALDAASDAHMAFGALAAPGPKPTGRRGREDNPPVLRMDRRPVEGVVFRDAAMVRLSSDRRDQKRSAAQAAMTGHLIIAGAAA